MDDYKYKMKNRPSLGTLNTTHTHSHSSKHTARENDGSRQSSVFSSVKHIQVMNINTNQLVAEGEREKCGFAVMLSSMKRKCVRVCERE